MHTILRLPGARSRSTQRAAAERAQQRQTFPSPTATAIIVMTVAKRKPKVPREGAVKFRGLYQRVRENSWRVVLFGSRNSRRRAHESND